MTIELVSTPTLALKRSVARYVGYNPYDTHSWMTKAVVPNSYNRNSQLRNEADANRALAAKAAADYAVYRRGR